VIAYRYRDYHNGTGSRVFLTENPVCYIAAAPPLVLLQRQGLVNLATKLIRSSVDSSNHTLISIIRQSIRLFMCAISATTYYHRLAFLSSMAMMAGGAHAPRSKLSTPAHEHKASKKMTRAVTKYQWMRATASVGSSPHAASSCPLSARHRRSHRRA
jgi:hypothetical protein